MTIQLHRDPRRSAVGGLRRPAVGAGAAAALALLTGAVLAAPAGASIEKISVAGLTSDKVCSVADGCMIQAALSGADAFSPVDFLVNGTVIGTLTPTSYGAGAAANLPWHPANDGTYNVGVRQGLSSSSIVYKVGAGGTCPPISSIIPGSSSSGSAGSGSASGSGDSGSASGSAGSGSAGTGSAGSGSASGSNQPLPTC
ncbi:hypothetical protein [Nocardia seriolae]|uniref:5'-nucleotidase n=2 Tax=Nocardia seriolae TaxID=37332 RepID=A0A0B8N7M2_9NOCA|nr:hypothetical protein [Nocardia seriolae]APB00021.1 5'-nucleotidase [Nocardia seriolae]MTJ64697.1 hypothetical protein [Nocardia seriolae]MTJ72976.1 hypothetical protein [Nocardia seriolae]MTJ89539.1 hypothetical protein [Nocardia seriolae]MTK42656.1 hypothetical protein [Nocardia seriolae]